MLARPDSDPVWAAAARTGDARVVRCMLAQLLGGAQSVAETDLQASALTVAIRCNVSVERVRQFVQLKGGAEFAPSQSLFWCVAFLIKSATVVAMTVVPTERERDADAVSKLIFANSRVAPAALLPVDAPISQSYDVGRRIGLTLGSLVSPILLAGAAAWLLLRTKVKSRVAVSVSAGVLLLLAGIGVIRSHGSIDSLIRLGGYTIALTLAYKPLADWLDKRSGSPGAAQT
jgi:hypothetical protein